MRYLREGTIRRLRLHDRVANQLRLFTGPLLPGPYRIKWAYLPKEFYCGGILTGKHWQPGTELPLPRNIFLHHANWTIGIENKIAQLKLVKDMIEHRKKSSE